MEGSRGPECHRFWSLYICVCESQEIISSIKMCNLFAFYSLVSLNVSIQSLDTIHGSKLRHSCAHHHFMYIFLSISYSIFFFSIVFAYIWIEWIKVIYACIYMYNNGRHLPEKPVHHQFERDALHPSPESHSSIRLWLIYSIYLYLYCSVLRLVSFVSISLSATVQNGANGHLKWLRRRTWNIRSDNKIIH